MRLAKMNPVERRGTRRPRNVGGQRRLIHIPEYKCPTGLAPIVTFSVAYFQKQHVVQLLFKRICFQPKVEDCPPS